MSETAPEQKLVVPSTKHFNFHKVFAAIGLILVGTSIVVFVALVYSGVNVADLFKSNIEDEDAGRIATNSSKPKATDSAKKDETADWEVLSTVTRESDASAFEDVKTVHFSFKYPKSYRVVNDEGIKVITNDDSYNAGIKTPGSSSFLGLLGDRGVKYDTTKSTTLGGKTAIRDTFSSKSDSSVNYTVNGLMTEEGKEVNFRFSCNFKGELTKDFESTCDMIASTFKFL